MKRLRLSVAALMGLVGYVAVAIAALASPAPFWAGATLMASLGLLAVALLGAIFDRGEHRAFWSGFAIVGWGYLALVFGPWFGATFATRLATTMLADALYLRLAHAPRAGEEVWADDSSGRNRKGTMTVFPPASKISPVYAFVFIDDRGNFNNQPVRSGDIKTIDRVGYRETFHGLACPIFALLGGLIARRFAERVSRRGNPPEMTSHPHPGTPPCDAP